MVFVICFLVLGFILFRIARWIGSIFGFSESWIRLTNLLKEGIRKLQKDKKDA